METSERQQEREQDAIDWEANAHKRKSADTLKELQLAKVEISKLNKQVREMGTADARRKAAELGRKESDQKWSERVNELNAEILKLRTEKGRGQRAILEGVIGYLQNQVNRLPAPEDVDRIPQPPVG